MRKDYLHNPTHLFVDDAPYFITAAIYLKRPLLKSPELKYLLLERIKHCFAKYQWGLHHWVILDNHYHLLGNSRVGLDLSKMMTNIHAYISNRPPRLRSGCGGIIGIIAHAMSEITGYGSFICSIIRSNMAA